MILRISKFESQTVIVAQLRHPRFEITLVFACLYILLVQI